jgi:hypothetical protein
MHIITRTCLAVIACATAGSAPGRAAAPPVPVPVYELRTYYPAPGKLAALNARFRDHTLKLFARHGMRNIAYWNAAPSAEAPDGRVVYILAYPDPAAREADWRAFGADPEWRAVMAASERDGKLVARVESVFMTMTDYSPQLPVLP